MKRTKALESTAYHEAGHAVQCFRENVRVKLVSIIRGEDYTGLVERSSVMKRRDRPDIEITLAVKDRMEREARIFLAGPLAQRRYNRKGFRRYHSEADYQGAVDFAMRLSGSGEIASAYIGLWEAQVRMGLDVRWHAVEAIAEALLTNGTLGGDEITRLVHCGKAPPSAG